MAVFLTPLTKSIIFYVCIYLFIHFFFFCKVVETQSWISSFDARGIGNPTKKYIVSNTLYDNFRCLSTANKFKEEEEEEDNFR